MKSLLISFLFCFNFALGVTAHAGEFVTLENGTELYTEYSNPHYDKPTVVLLNGLTDSLENWQAFADDIAPNANILRYDMTGQGETVLQRLPVNYAIELENQVEELRMLLAALRLDGTPVVLVGLSYGGGVAIAYGATYPENVDAIVAMAPYTKPVTQQDAWVKSQISTARMINPLYWSLYNDDQMYDYFLKSLIYTTFGSQEPTLYQYYPNRMEATFQMVTGIRKFDARNVSHKLPKGSLHLIVAGSDEYLSRDELDPFWQSVPAELRGSRIDILRTKHRLPSTATKFVGAWLKLILENDSRLSQGAEYVGNKSSGMATSRTTTVRVLEN